jgi:uncharacterized protein YjiS (DUF1127 family)
MTGTFAARNAVWGRRAAEPAPARNALALFLAGIGDGWRAWTRYRALSALGDGELARLGLSRGDIARHAVLGAPADDR